MITLLVWLADITPTPTPVPTFTDDQVTPGIVGFIVTFGIALATVLLVIDMTRRIRRVRYRAEIQEQLEAERAAEADEAGEAGKAKPAPED